MKKTTYRNIVFTGIHMLLGAFFLLLFSCDEEEARSYGNPTISIIEEPGFVSTDTIIAVSQVFKFKIHAEWNGHDRLTNLIAKLNGERYSDVGFYEEIYDRVIEVPKGLEDIENWEFIIRDIEGNSASTGLTVTKDPNVVFGEIDEFLNVQMGAQNNTEIGSFFSFSNGNVYNLQEAFNNQEIMDMVYLYDNFTTNQEENIISSPGGNINDAFTGTYGISEWTTRNTIRYSRAKIDVSIEEFDNAANDSIIIANSFDFGTGGRKAKFLQAGDIYSFVREDNVAGIFKVVSTSGTTNGDIVVDIKIQKL